MNRTPTPGVMDKTLLEVDMSNRTDWPFTVELVPLDELFADSNYQRPPQEVFVDRMVNSFDDTLVGVLDASDRGNGSSPSYAILDGVQRFTAMKKVGKHTVYIATYEGMTIQEEATFFYRKNKDRRGVHPFYNIRARRVAGDEKATEIFGIVEAHGYKLDVSGTPENSLPAIRSIEHAYGYSSAKRTESLSPTLRTLRKTWHGRRGGKDSALISGLGRFFQPFDDNEIDLEHLIDRLSDENPRTIVTRARETYFTRAYSANPVAEEIIKIYNRGLKRNRLNRNLLTKTV
jgi:hypothetical protein